MMRFLVISTSGEQMFVEGLASAAYLFNKCGQLLAVSANSYNGDPKMGGIQTEKYRMRPADGFVPLLRRER